MKIKTGYWSGPGKSLHPLLAFFALSALLMTVALSGCSPSVGADEAIRRDNPVSDMHTNLRNKLDAEGQRFDWYSYEDAVVKARTEKKHVMIIFHTSWCKWCKKLLSESLTDPEVSGYIKDNFVAVKIDAESSSLVVHEMRNMSMMQLGEEYGVTNYPTVWFLEPDGTKAKPLNGYLPPADFLIFLKYIRTGSYKTG